MAAYGFSSPLSLQRAMSVGVLWQILFPNDDRHNMSYLQVKGGYVQ